MLMPVARYTYERIPPLNEARNIEQHLTALYNLTELAEASKILLGAQYRCKGVLRILYSRFTFFLHCLSYRWSRSF